jgi:ribonuclease HI
MVSGWAQATLFAPQSAIRKGTARVSSWELPAYIVAQHSPSVAMGLPRCVHPAIVHKRIALALGIEDGDSVEFYLSGNSERISLPVAVLDVRADFLVHPLLGSVPEAVACMSSPMGDVVQFQNRDLIKLFNQNVWDGTTIVNQSGKCILRFDGASRDNPRGPAGCGFAIYSSEDCSCHDDDLAMGYRFYERGSSNEMEYLGLIEGLHWASKLKLTTLVVEGDSQLVIRQMKGEYAVDAPNLLPSYRTAQYMVNSMTKEGLKVMFRHIGRKRNTVSDDLANRAIDLRANKITVTWACARYLP